MIDVLISSRDHIDKIFYFLIALVSICTVLYWIYASFAELRTKKKAKDDLLYLSGLSDKLQLHQVKTASEETILLRQWPNTLHHKELPLSWTPAFVTSMGVLGTFTGISVGLTNMELVDPSQTGSSNQLITSIGELLDGMKTAFYTSVAGIICGLLLSFLRHLIFVPIINKITSKALTELSQGNVRLFDMADLLDNSGGADMVNAAKAMTEASRSFNADSIADRMTQSLSPILEKVSEELGKLSDIKKENGEAVLQKMMQDLRSQVIEPIQERLENTAHLVEHSNQSVNNLTEILSPLGSELANTIENLQTHQKDSIASIESVLTRFQEDVGEKLSEQLTTAGAILNETLERLNNDLGTHLLTLNELAKQMPSLDAELVSSIEGVLTQVIGTSSKIHEQLKEGADYQHVHLKSLIDEVNNYHSASREFLDEYVKTVNSTSTQVHGRLLDVAKVLANASTLSDTKSSTRVLENEPA